MAEYIEREALIEALMNMPMRFNHEKWKVFDLLKNAPAADVAEIVRCKDCCYGRNNNCVHGEDSVTYDTEWFCADGERVIDNGEI